MKKVLFILLIILLLGCNSNKKSPTSMVKKYFISYQKLDKNVQKNINILVENEIYLNDYQKEKYRKILKKHYKSLKYKIKKEKIINDSALVLTEIEVNNNIKVLKQADYKKNNFIDNKGNFLINEFNNYKIDMLSKEESKIKYEIVLNLHIENNKWVIDKITEENQKKILGIYDI